MRVPLDVGPLMQGDDRQRRDILAQLVAVVAEINRHGLGVLVTLFPPSLQHELPETYLDGLDGPKFRAYAAEVARVAAALATVHSGVVALEPMNEPQSKCRVVFGTDWSAYQQVMIERIRRISAQLPLFLTGGCWSNIEGLADLDSDLAARPAQFRQHPFLLSVPVHASGRDVVGALSRRHDRRALSGIGRKYSKHAGFDAAPHPDGSACRRAPTASARKPKRKRKSKNISTKHKGPQQIEEWMSRVAEWQQPPAACRPTTSSSPNSAP